MLEGDVGFSARYLEVERGSGATLPRWRVLSAVQCTAAGQPLDGADWGDGRLVGAAAPAVLLRTGLPLARGIKALCRQLADVLLMAASWRRCEGQQRLVDLRHLSITVVSLLRWDGISLLRLVTRCVPGAGGGGARTRCCRRMAGRLKVYGGAWCLLFYAGVVNPGLR
jgi:hypothetical protein